MLKNTCKLCKQEYIFDNKQEYLPLCVECNEMRARLLLESYLEWCIF